MNLKNLNFFFIWPVLLFVLLSCDPYHDIEWRVKNNTDKNISIISKSWQDTVDQLNSLSSGLILQLYYDGDLGTVKSEIMYTKHTPFEKLIIQNAKGDTIKKDVYLSKNWKAINVDDRIAEYTLEVDSLDF